MTLTTKVLLGMALGIAVGLGINVLGLAGEGSFIQAYLIGRRVE